MWLLCVAAVRAAAVATAANAAQACWPSQLCSVQVLLLIRSGFPFLQLPPSLGVSATKPPSIYGHGSGMRFIIIFDYLPIRIHHITARNV